MQKSSRFPVAAVVLILFIIVTAIGSYTRNILYLSCDVETVRAAGALLVRQRDRFDHSYQFATSASRDAVVRPVAELQQILMDTQGLGVPACMRKARGELVDYMITVIRAFQAYGAQEPDGTIRDLLGQSDEYYFNFAEELEAVNECAPFCIP
jgi:hypothetical protein